MMNLRLKWLITVAVAVLGFSYVTGRIVQAAPAGSEADPLISRSYLQLYLAEQLNPLSQQLQDLSARVAELEKRVALLKARLNPKITLTIGKNVAYIGDQPKTLDAPPYLSDSGRTMLPFRFLGEALGARVDWENSTRTVTYRLGSRLVTMSIGGRTATVDGQKVQLDSPPQLVNNRTMVPLRAISELLGARVDWDNTTQTVTVQP